MRFAHLVLFFGLLTTVLTMPCPTFAATTNFSLTPNTIENMVGQKFNLDLSVDSGATKLDALEIKLKFDPKKLQLTDFQTTNVFNAEVRKTIDNQAGTLTWTTTDISKPRKIISGKTNLGTLTFTSKESGMSAVSLSQAQVGSIDTPNITSNNVSVSVNSANQPGLLQQFMSFLRNLFSKN